MTDRLPILVVLALASLPAAAATNATRNFGVSGFERIRVDGPYEVHLKTGVAPFARATARNQAAIDGISVKVEGSTLVIRKDPNGWGGYSGDNHGPVVIDVGTHDLTNAWLNGAGSLSINRVKGLGFDLNIEGAGVGRIEEVAVDQFRVSVSGSGTARLAGKTLKTTALARGSVNIDAEGLSAKDAVITAEGPSLVRLNASDTARVNAFGVSAVTLGGKPSCTLRVQGSASVSGCKDSN